MSLQCTCNPEDAGPMMHMVGCPMRPATPHTDFPLYLYLYNPDGTYGAPVDIQSDNSLQTLFRLVVLPSVRSGLEVVITDPLDLCVFHAKDGVVLFPEVVK